MRGIDLFYYRKYGAGDHAGFKRVAHHLHRSYPDGVSFALVLPREKIKPNLIYGSIIALIGVAFVVFNGSFLLKINPLGDILTLIAALMWAFYCLILKQMGNRYPTLLITRKVFFYGLVTLTPMFLLHPLNTDTAILFRPVVAANLLFLGVVASMLCYIMWNTAVKELGPFRTANYIYIVPLVTLITSAIVIDEIITVIALIGSVFILSGVYIAERGFHFKSQPLMHDSNGLFAFIDTSINGL